MTVKEAFERLDRAGASREVITYVGRPTTPRELYEVAAPGADASKIRIGYYADPRDPSSWDGRGTLARMALERGRK
jgi:DNA-binding protein H-NS